MNKFISRLLSTALVAVLALSTSACLYRLDTQQGNLVDAEKAEQLKAGMTRLEVKELLGTPLIQDPFHPDRWDYVYYYRSPNGKEEGKRITVLFRKDLLVKTERAVINTDFSSEVGTKAPAPVKDAGTAKPVDEDRADRI